jgi:hypothetical protein
MSAQVVQLLVEHGFLGATKWQSVTLEMQIPPTTTLHNF